MDSRSFTVNVKLTCNTNDGDVVILSGSVPELGGWREESGIALTTTPASYPVWTGAVTLSQPTLIQYKFFIRRADGSVEWELGNNRLRNIMQDETIDCSVFQRHTFQASDQQFAEAVRDHQRYFELFPSISEFHKLEDKIDSLNAVIASMRAHNERLTRALAEAQEELYIAKKSSGTDRTAERENTSTFAGVSKASLSRPPFVATGAALRGGFTSTMLSPSVL